MTSASSSPPSLSFTLIKIDFPQKNLNWRHTTKAERTPNIPPGYYPQQSLAHCTDPAVRVPLQLELYCIVRQVCLNVYINLKLLSHKKREPIKLNLLVNGLGVVDIWSSMEPKTYQGQTLNWIKSQYGIENISGPGYFW